MLTHPHSRPRAAHPAGGNGDRKSGAAPRAFYSLTLALALLALTSFEARAQDAPTISSATRGDSLDETTAADTLAWDVTFSRAVQNVGGGDFSVVDGDGDVITGTTAALVDDGDADAATYRVSVSGGDLTELYNGAAQLAINMDHGILAEESDETPLANPATAAQVIAGAETFTVDNPPVLISITVDLTGEEWPAWFSIPVTYTFSEPTTGIQTGVLELTRDRTVLTQNNTSFAVSTTDPNSYVISFIFAEDEASALAGLTMEQRRLTIAANAARISDVEDQDGTADAAVVSDRVQALEFTIVPFMSLSLDPPEISEDGGTSTLTATLARDATQTTTVTLAPPEGSETDFTPGDATLEFAVGDREKTTTITAVSNSAVTEDQTFDITVSTTPTIGNSTPTYPTATLTIVNTTTLPSVGITGPGVVDEGSTGNEFTLTRDGGIARALMVDVQLADRDGAITMQTVQIDANQATKAISFDDLVTDNSRVDGPTRVAARIQAISDRYRLGDNAAAYVWVMDTQAPLSLSLSADTISEDGGAARLTATRTTAADRDTIVTFTATPGPGAVAGDFTLADAVTIPAGFTTASTTITAVANAVDTADKTVLISATVTGAVTPNPAPVILTIADNDLPETLPVVTITGPAFVKEQGDDSATTNDVEYVITRTGDTSQELDVGFVQLNALRTDPDAEEVIVRSPGALTIPAGQASVTNSFLRQPSNDGANSQSRTWVLITPSNDYTVGVPGYVNTIYIDDDVADDAAPTLVVSPNRIAKNDGVAGVRLVLPSAAPAGGATIPLQVHADSTAVAADYTISGMTLTVAEGETESDEITITGMINPDDTADKTLLLETPVTGAIPASARQTLTIYDDTPPSPPQITVTANAATVSEGSPAGFTFTRDAAAEADFYTGDLPRTYFLFEITDRDGARTLQRRQFTQTSLTSTSTVTTTNTAAAEGPTSVSVRLLPGNGYTVGATGLATTTVTDTGVITPTLALSAATIDEDGGATTLRASLPAPAPMALTLALSAEYPDSTGFTDFFVEDATVLDTGLMFAEGATASANSITLTAKPDNTTTGTDPEITFTLAAQTGVTAEAEATLTISEQVPVAHVAQEFQHFTQGHGSPLTDLLNLRVSPIPPPGLMVNVEITYRDGAPQTLQVATDGAPLSGPRDANGQRKEITVAFGMIEDDDDINTVHTVSARVLPGDGYVIATDRPNFATTTIVDNDALEDETQPTLTATNTVIPEGGSVQVAAEFPPARGTGPTQETGRPTADGELTLEVMSATGPAGQALVEGTDYEFTGGPLGLRMDAGATTGNYTLRSLVDNDQYDGPRTIVIRSLANLAAGLMLPSDPLTFTIVDDDLPAVTVAGPATAAEGTDFDFTFTRTGNNALALPISVEITDRAGDDDTVTVTFAANSATAVHSVTGTGNEDFDGPTGISARVLPMPAAEFPDAYAVGDPDAATVMITDDDPQLTLALDSATIEEDGGRALLTATLARAMPDAIDITLTVTPGTGASADDYMIDDTTLTIPAFFTTARTAILARDNDAISPNKTFTIAASGITPAPMTATLTIRDDDAPFALTAPPSNCCNWPAGMAITALTLPAASGGQTPLTYTLAPEGGGALPAGLTFAAAANARTLSGTPTAAGTTTLTYTVTDADSETATAMFDVTIAMVLEEAAGDLADGRLVYEDVVATPVTFPRVPANGGATGDVMYALTLANGDPLPAGLTFTGNNRMLSATTGLTGRLELKYTATDSAATPNTATLEVVISDTRFGPATTPDDQAWAVGESVSLTLPEAQDNVGDVTYALTGPGAGGALPAGLSFDANSRILSGAPTTAGVTTLTYTLTDADDPGNPVAVTFEVTIQLGLAAATGNLADGALRYADLPFTLPAAVGADGAVTYALTLNPTGGLPAWLSFDGTSRVLSLSDADMATGRMALRYTATDSGTPANTTMLDFVLHSQLALTAPPSTCCTWPAGMAITDLTLPAASGVDGDLTYALTLEGGGALPAGLMFDAAADTRELSGTPTVATTHRAPGYATLTYTVTDTDGTAATEDDESASVMFNVIIQLVMEQPTPAVAALQAGEAMRFEDLRDNPITFPMITAGADGAVYAMTDVSAANAPSTGPGEQLPTWLEFDPDTRTLTLMQPEQASGRLILRYTATDSAADPANPNVFTLLEFTLGGEEDGARRENRLTSMVGAVGRALGWDIAGTIRERTRETRSGTHAPVRVSGVSNITSLEDLATRGASVEIALNADAAANNRGGAGGGHLWARVGRNEFDSEPLEDYEQDGELTSLHAGVDVQSGPDRLFGAAIGWHDAQVDYDDREAEVEGDLELEMLTINPYASRTRDRWHAWGALGFGVGEMTYSETSRGGGEETSQSEVTLWNAAGGLEYTADFIGASELTARGEGMFLSMDVDGTDNANLEFGPLRADVYGARGEVEVGLPMVRADGGTMRPFAVLGMRWEDGDDNAEGLSAELGGGITARNRDFFVDATIRARTGVEDEVGDALAWGLSLGFDVKNDNRGLAVELHHQSGPQPWDPFADNGLATASETSTDTGDTPATLGATTRYGLDYRNGRMTPYNTLRFDGGLLTEVETGVQYRLSNISLGLKHVYEPAADPGNADEHSLKLIGRITF